MTTIDLAELRALAEAATRGPWKVARWSASRTHRYVNVRAEGRDWGDIARLYARNEGRNADYIAAANPTTILALLDALGRKDRALRDMTTLAAAGLGPEHHCGDCELDEDEHSAMPSCPCRPWGDRGGLDG